MQHKQDQHAHCVVDISGAAQHAHSLPLLLAEELLHLYKILQRLCVHLVL